MVTVLFCSLLAPVQSRPYRTSANYIAAFNRDKECTVVEAGEYDEKRIQANCRKRFGISGDADWSVISLGGMDFSAASNIVFSNGEYDPWSIGGLP